MASQGYYGLSLLSTPTCPSRLGNMTEELVFLPLFFVAAMPANRWCLAVIFSSPRALGCHSAGCFALFSQRRKMEVIKYAAQSKMPPDEECNISLCNSDQNMIELEEKSAFCPKINMRQSHLFHMSTATWRLHHTWLTLHGVQLQNGYIGSCNQILDNFS